MLKPIGDMEDPSFFHQGQMDIFDDFTSEDFAAAFGDDFIQHYYPSDCLSLYLTINPSTLEPKAAQTCFEKPTKQLKTTHIEESCSTEQKSTPKDGRISQGAYPVQNYSPKAGQGNKQAIAQSVKQSSYKQDHIIAERKRREKLSQQFITLTTIVPGLKKMDKTSVLGESIKYLKELQGRVKTLEEQTAKNTMESIVFVKKFQNPSDNLSSLTDTELPEIEARVSGKNVLIRIHCEKQKGVLVRALAEIEKINLFVVNSSAIPFGTSTLDITVMAQMDEGYNMAVQDFVKKLRSSFHESV